MTKDQAAFLHKAMVSDGMNSSILSDYSGRGMYGDKTHAIVCDDIVDILGPALRVAFELQELEGMDDMPDFDDFDPSVDSMGTGCVIY